MFKNSYSEHLDAYLLQRPPKLKTANLKTSFQLPFNLEVSKPDRKLLSIFSKKS